MTDKLTALLDMIDGAIQQADWSEPRWRACAEAMSAVCRAAMNIKQDDLYYDSSLPEALDRLGEVKL